jgi:predicted DCC family thiol-disulfide oxidoreductase YuxK
VEDPTPTQLQITPPTCISLAEQGHFPFQAYLCNMKAVKDKKIILFDGVCNLCNGAVQFVIKHDREDRFRFAALQSETGSSLSRERHIDPAKMDSIILIDPGTAYYTKSDAALEIARDLKGYGFLPILFSWIPRSIRDAVYDLVARNRYRWFGRKEQCMIPSPELQVKFLN